MRPCHSTSCRAGDGCSGCTSRPVSYQHSLSSFNKLTTTSTIKEVGKTGGFICSSPNKPVKANSISVVGNCIRELIVTLPFYDLRRVNLLRCVYSAPPNFTAGLQYLFSLGSLFNYQ